MPAATLSPDSDGARRLLAMPQGVYTCGVCGARLSVMGVAAPNKFLLVCDSHDYWHEVQEAVQ
jgi:hypothetical protein